MMVNLVMDMVMFAFMHSATISHRHLAKIIKDCFT